MLHVSDISRGLGVTQCFGSVREREGKGLCRVGKALSYIHPRAPSQELKFVESLVVR